MEIEGEAAYFRNVVWPRLFGESSPGGDLARWVREHDARHAADRVREGEAALRLLLDRECGRDGTGESLTDDMGLAGRHIFALGEAHLFSRDERYARILAAALGRWVLQCELRRVAAERGREPAAAWALTGSLYGWLLGAKAVSDSPSLDDARAGYLLTGILDTGRALERRADAAGGDPVDRGAAHAGLALLGLLVPEHVASREWLDRGLGELACDVEALIGAAPWDALEIYVPLLALSAQNGLEVPSRVLAEVERAAASLEAKRERRGPACRAPMLPFFPSASAREQGLLFATRVLFGREEALPPKPREGLAAALTMIASPVWGEIAAPGAAAAGGLAAAV